MTDGLSPSPASEEAAPPPEVEEEGPPPEVEEEGRFSINEDWAATIFGLVLLLLVLAGVITGSFMKGLIP
jgi:hypothetical protein